MDSDNSTSSSTAFPTTGAIGVFNELSAPPDNGKPTFGMLLGLTNWALEIY